MNFVQKNQFHCQSVTPPPPEYCGPWRQGNYWINEIIEISRTDFFLLSKAQHKYCGPRDEKGMAEGHPEVGEDGFFPTPP